MSQYIPPYPAGQTTMAGAQCFSLASDQPAIGISGTVGISNFPASQLVTGTFWQSTQPVSLAATVVVKADTAANQANALKVDGSATTQPVSGTFWQATQPISGTITANIGTTNGLALDATLTGGTQKAILRGGAKGTTTAADVTSVSVDGNTQALHANVTNFPATQAVSGTFWQATQPVSLSTLPALVAGSALIGKVGIDQTTPGTTNGVQITNASVAVTGTFWQATQPVSGTVTANAGSNLNTSALALEAGNLATLTAKDFATQATLSSIKAKTDNLDTALSGIKTGTDKIPASPATEGGNLAAIAANQATAANQTTANTTLSSIKTDVDALNVSQGAAGITQTGPMVQAMVSDTPSSYIDTEIRPLSITPEGRLRVSAISAYTYMEFFPQTNLTTTEDFNTMFHIGDSLFFGN